MATDLTETPAPELGARAGPTRPSAQLPDQAVLVHIGPHKTGTTTIQAAFHASRRDLAGQGVTYAGDGRRPILAVLALRGARGKNAAVPGIGHWADLAEQARRATGRVVVSNEALADASRGAIARLAGDLGRDRIYVVATLRPLAAILPSQWQQFVKGGLTASFDDWLREVLDPNDAARRKLFWRRHRHDELIRRWVDAVGSDRVSVIVLDEDPSRLPRLFEGLLGLRDGTLADRAGVRNRSLTWPEAEAIRAINQAFRAAEYPAALQTRLIARGLTRHLLRRDPDPAESRVEIPSWAVERVAMVGREIVGGLVESRVRIIGDVDRLLKVPVPRVANADVRIPAEVSGAVSMAAVEAIVALGKRPQPNKLAELDGVPSGRLAGALAQRLIAIPRSGWRSIRGGTSGS